ncbi:MAG TPA: glycosyltransferase N-terminal domain-containing protein, partial [Opitutus sp.]|nr:glycosyltransferase N-terminal domain-containing protein [Opitutus sp.]
SHDVEVYLTTTTSTGHRVAIDRYGKLMVGLGYFPIDWWLFSARAWRRIQPDLVVLTEGERWPEHMHQAKARGVPVVCINARLSDRSYHRLKRFAFVRRAVLDGITRLLPSSLHDEARFGELGFPRERMLTTGNIKLDLSIPPLAAGERERLRRELGLGSGPVLLGSSTWPGEERALLAAWSAARKRGIGCSLLIVPRHAERRPELERLLQAAGVTHHFRSRGAAPGPVDVSVADTTGELRNLTQLADLVFVGKSLAPNDGGQTPVEAAALRKPMLMGPRMSNFRSIARDLLATGAAVEVFDEFALAQEVPALLADTIRRGAMAGAAGEWQRANAGAVERTLAVIREELGKAA